MEISSKDFYNDCKSKLSRMYCEEYPTLADYMRKCEMEWVNDGKPENEKYFGYQHVCPTEKYCNSSIRVMIIGQENNGWRTIPTDLEQAELKEMVNESMKGTQDFQVSNGHRKSPFFKFSRAVSTKFNGDNYDTIESVAWTNILKVSPVLHNAKKYKYSKYLPNEKPELIEEYCTTFKTIVKEIKIVKPHYLLFLTGPFYDKYIRLIFNGVNFEQACLNINSRAFAKLSHEYFPENTFRLYHPGYLNRRKKTFWNPILENLKIFSMPLR